ncbi:AIPR family protein [Rothia kristinae]
MENTNTLKLENIGEGSAWAHLATRTDLMEYVNRALGVNNYGCQIALFAAALKYRIEDMESFAIESLTDGHKDKKCDLVGVMRDDREIVIAQAYATTSPRKRDRCPLGKVDDLNTGVSWLLAGDLKDMSDILAQQALQARSAIDDGDIDKITIWSVHNCHESEDAKNSLAQCRRSALSVLSNNFKDASDITVVAEEVGLEEINSLYERTKTPILVSDILEFDVPGSFETSGKDWSVLHTVIKLSDLQKLWKKYNTRLVSPNIRDYLGFRNSEKNINNGIRNTAETEPHNFSIYNNGITALVNDFEKVNESKCQVEGMGIVNGGQTTGSIGNLTNPIEKDSDGFVQIRFVKIDNNSILDNVIKFNNTQNKVEASDFRSKDKVQNRLREEFEKIEGVQYNGGRRGGVNPAMKTPPEVLPDKTVAQALTSFHGDPNLAYNKTRTVWEEDKVYSRYFNENLTADHVIFCASLLKVIEDRKAYYRSKDESDLTKHESKIREYFSSRGAVFVMTAALGKNLDSILGRSIPDEFSLKFSTSYNLAEAKKAWEPIVNKYIHFAATLKSATDAGLKSKERITNVIEQFGAQVSAINSSGADDEVVENFKKLL